MRQVAPGTHDPAPSRWSYRVQRWMLTPGIRFALRAGIPLALVAGTVAAVLSDEERRIAINDYVIGLRASIQERPEFMVGLMAIDGAGPDVADDIREVVPLDFPISSFDLDLETIRETVMGLDPVKEASVRIRPGSILQIDVIERTPVLVWRTREGLTTLDETGVRVGPLTRRTDRGDLPLIAGEGAKDHVAEALALFAAAAPLQDRLRGLVRVGQRRWDVILDRGQSILLPTEHPVRALERVIALSEAPDIDMLERDLAVVDMRIAARPTIRMNPDAVQDWWKIRQINESGQ